MRLPELQRILVEAARGRDYPPGRHGKASAQPRRRMFGRPPHPAVVPLVVLVLAASAAAAVISLTRSQPLSGTSRRGPVAAIGHGPTHYVISVFPALQVGWSGWCTSIDFRAAHRRVGTVYGCGAVESSDPPVIADGGFAGSRSGNFTYAIVSDAVARVHFSTGATVVPIADPRLPAGTRAFFALDLRERRAGRGPRGIPILLPPQEIFLDAHGRAITEPVISRSTAVEHLPLQQIANPAHPHAAAQCALRIAPRRSLTPLSETVATPVPWPRREAGAFLSCANAIFRLGSTRLAVAVLVDATDPREIAPQLPGLRSDAAHPGLLLGHELGSIGDGMNGGVADLGGIQPFDTPTRTQLLADHDVSARRAGGAWLVAEGGTPAQRAVLLGALALPGAPLGRALSS